METQNPKTRYGMCKPSLALLPGPAQVAAAIVHELGAKKYGAYNWRTVPKIELMVYLNAILRHLHRYIDGEDLDEESGQSHLAHVIACCNIVIDAEHIDNLHDDRPPYAPTSEMIEKFTKPME